MFPILCAGGVFTPYDSQNDPSLHPLAIQRRQPQDEVTVDVDDQALDPVILNIGTREFHVDSDDEDDDFRSLLI